MNNVINNQSKTITAWEVKLGQRVRIEYKGKTYEQVVEWINRNTEENTISLWGVYALSFIGASERVILIDENNCEFFQRRDAEMQEYTKLNGLPE
jgi:hypothetical protein